MDQSQAILDKIEIIGETVNEIKTDQAVMKSDVKRMCDMVEKHERIIKGKNGDPGCLAYSKEYGRMANDHETLLYGEAGKPGLIDKVNRLTGLRANLSRSLWIVAGAVIGSGVSIYIHGIFTQ